MYRYYDEYEAEWLRKGPNGKSGTPEVAVADAEPQEVVDAEPLAAPKVGCILAADGKFYNTVAEAREMHLETILEKRGGLSDSVYAVIRKATAINPKERYQSAAAMKMDLKQALIAPPPTDRRWMYIAGAAIGAIAILIIILLLIL